MIKQTTKYITLASGMAMACASGVYAKKHSAKQPNVIVILTDDQGYGDVGFNGCKDIPTPNIDRIANNGVKFTNGYVTYAVSGPSRAGLITGRYQDRFGFGRNPLFAPNDPNQGVPLSEEMLSSALKRGGYKSMAVGKWHLGAHKTLQPLERGFDEFFGFLSGGHHYLPEKWTLNDASEVKTQFGAYKTKLLKNRARIDEKEYLTDALSREAVEFVERNSENPFFIYLAYNAPHTPLQATKKYLDRFSHIKNKRRRTYAAMVSAVDDGVGKLLDKLEELNISENTIVFFLSDNGGPEKHNASDNALLRDGKSSLYEGGIRVPFAMQWPGKIPSGVTYDNPVISLDIFATALAYTKVKPKNRLDGVNLVPFVNGKKKSQPHDKLFWRKFDQKSFAIRKGDDKLVKYKKGGEELYNLSDDISETASISDKKKHRQLKKQYDKWVKSLKDPVFLGLRHNKEYSQLNPDRFKMVNPYKPDHLEPKIPEGFSLTWSDEFNVEGKPNEKYWNYENGFVRNKELQWYHKANANINGGVLVIESKREQIKNSNYKPNHKDWRRKRKFANYSSACVKTNGKFSFKYGILEVRAKIDTAMGLWPAIWTLGIKQPWPANGEVDLLEYYQVKGEATILANAAHSGKWRKPVWDSEKIPYSKFSEKEEDWYKKFHIWKMEWTPKYIRLYLDDQLLNEIDITKTKNPDGFNPFHQPHFILLNQAIGGLGGDPSKTSFPRRYEVDYVRVYQK